MKEKALLIVLTSLFSFSSLLAQETDAFKLAEDALKNGRHTEAYEAYKTASQTYLAQKELASYAFCNLRMAECRLREGKADLATQLASRTTHFLTEMALKEADLVAYSQLIEGEAWLNLGRNDLALENFKKAEGYYDSYQDLTSATCYNLLGVAYWNNENKVTSLFYHEKALQIREQLLPINDPLLADSYNNIGLVYLGDQDLKALIHFDKALKIYQAKFGKTNPKVANCYSNMAFANSNQKNYNEALQYLDEVMRIWEVNYAGDHPNKAFTLSNRGRIMESQGDLSTALQFEQEALQMYSRLFGSKHPEIANTYFLIGTLKQKQSHFAEAVANFQASIYANLFDQEFSTVYDLPELTNYYNADILLTSLQAKAKALEALHFEKTLKFRDLNGALLTYEKCDDLISQIRRIRLSERDKLRLGSIASDVYQNGIRIALVLSEGTFQKRYFQEKAFLFCERSKSAVLLDAIQETKAKSFSGIPTELLSLEDSLKAEISFFERQLAAAPDNQSELKSQLFDYQKAYRAFVSQLETDYPDYFRLKYNQSYPTMEDIREAIGEEVAVLSYFTSSDRFYIFLISKEETRVIEKPRTENFAKQVSAFRNSMRYRLQNSYLSAASELHNQLIPKIPQGVNQLIVLPDGVLGTLPFEALIAPTNDEKQGPNYLLKTYAISYDYGATLLLERINKSKSSGGKGILLAAPVSFQGNDLKMATLPGSESEIKEIKYLFSGSEHSPTLLLNKDASESQIKSASLAQYRYLHFATHGVVDESRPELSRVFLAPDANEDGSLYNGEIFNLKINARLVTLSACETGLGKVTKGEGIVGLSRSLLYAGAENLIVSLWQVADASTAQLMIEFYRQHLHHSSNTQLSDDLRKAKLHLLQSDQFSDPYFWAPFILIGQ